MVVSVSWRQEGGSDDFEFLEFGLWQDPIDPTALFVILGKHFVEFTNLTFGTALVGGFAGKTIRKCVAAFGVSGKVVVVPFQVINPSPVLSTSSALKGMPTMAAYCWAYSSAPSANALNLQMFMLSEKA